MRRIIQLIIVSFAFVILVYNAKRIYTFQDQNQYNRMVNNTDIPPSLALTTFALGPLKAIIVDSLWRRAIQQQDKGEYFDALQLADWITKLQPTFSSVWAFHGWNMSYNIAHDFADAHDRWNWINHGIELLRDEGLKYNPGDKIIRHELARIFYNRIGGKIDEGSEYFKNQWAFKMMEYFDYSSQQEIINLSNAAKNLDELKERYGVEGYLRETLKSGVDILNFKANPPSFTPIKVKLPLEEQNQAVHEIYYYFKRNKIERELKLDVQRILFINKQYGPLDWRLHQAHTIYWAAEDNFEDFMKGGVNYSKIVRQSMIESFYEGKLFHDPVKNIISRTNNLEIIGRIHDYIDYLIEHDFNSDIDSIHKKFLENAVTVLYNYNRNEEAGELFKHYKEHYLQKNPIDYEAFIVKSIETSLYSGTTEKIKYYIESVLYQSFQWLDHGDYDRSNGNLNLAKLLWKRYQLKFEENPAKKLGPFSEIVEIVKTKYISEKNIQSDKFSIKIDQSKTRKPKKVKIGSYHEDDHHDH